jgi:hypothetical protein
MPLSMAICTTQHEFNERKSCRCFHISLMRYPSALDCTESPVGCYLIYTVSCQKTINISPPTLTSPPKEGRSTTSILCSIYHEHVHIASPESLHDNLPLRHPKTQLKPQCPAPRPLSCNPRRIHRQLHQHPAPTTLRAPQMGSSPPSRNHPLQSHM